MDRDDGGPVDRMASRRQYSWAEVRAAVHELRKELAPLSTMSPSNVTFRKLPNGLTRVYFLRPPAHGWEITLLYADVDSTQPPTTRIECKPLMESNVTLVAAARSSREEQLLSERQRVATWGISSYELHQQSGRVLFPCASSLFVVAPAEETRQSGPLEPRVLSTGGGGAPLTPAMCPRCPRLVAHAARGDVWLAGGGAVARPIRLTYACKGSEKLADDPRMAGVPSYVTQEEFSRYTGFWWQPKSNDDVFRIVYEEVDESEVSIYSFPSSRCSSGDSEEFRFPRAGTPNARSILRLVTFRLQQSSPVTVLDYYRQSGDSDPHSSHAGEAGWSECQSARYLDQRTERVRWFDMRRSLTESGLRCEYVARVGWTECGQFVWAQLLDRKQRRLDLVLIHLEEFCEPFTYERCPQQSLEEERLVLVEPSLVYTKQILISETAPTAWINVHDILVFLSQDNPNNISFIWASEETGHLHLYLVTSALCMDRRDPQALEEGQENGGLFGPVIISKVALTAGTWEVIGRKIWVDKTHKLVYFIGLRETPLERHLYVASYERPDPDSVQLLTEPGYSYNVDMDEDCSMVVMTRSNVSTAPISRLYTVHLQGDSPTLRVTLVPRGTLPSRSASVEPADCDATDGRWNGSRESSKSDSPDVQTDDSDNSGREEAWNAGCTGVGARVPPPQIYCTRVSAGGAGAAADAYCLLWRPADCEPGAKYPTVLHVYGGPEVQTVTNSYKGIRQLRMHMLAARGFCVVAVDSRGSKHRGRAWEAAIRAKMGQVELDDQVEVLQWLAKETGCIDLERVAIHGWSYGGYLSLLGIATRPNVFKACAAGAPVTCWRLYDTAYTERYMGLPSHSPHAYTRASVLTHAPFFPDREGRLLIIHGLADENVHFCHTAALVAELVRLGKPHQLQLYPGERHSLRALHAAKHYEATLLYFLHNNL